MHAVHVDAEEGVGQETVAQSGRVGEEDGDEQGEQGEGDGEAELAEAGVHVLRVDHVVVVAVPEEDVLLHSTRRGALVEIGGEIAWYVFFFDPVGHAVLAVSG